MKLAELSNPEDQFMFEMANFDSRRTGIDQVILWASQAPPGALRHAPRIKVSSSYTSSAKVGEMFVLTIHDEPQVVAGECNLSSETLQDVKDWVVLNKEVLLSFWRGELLTDDFLDSLQKLR